MADKATHWIDTPVPFLDRIRNVQGRALTAVDVKRLKKMLRVAKKKRGACPRCGHQARLGYELICIC